MGPGAEPSQVLAAYRGGVGPWPGQSQENLGTRSFLCSVSNSGRGYLSSGWAQGRRGQTEEGEGHREGLWSSVGKLKAGREGM